MTMLKKLKSLFIEEDPNAPTSQEQKETSESPQTSETSTPYTANTNKESISYNSGSIEKVDPKFMDILFKAIEEKNKEGFDYLEFKNSLQSLSKLNMDEVTQYKSAFAMGKTMGLTKEILLQSVQQYISVINEEEKKFKDTLQKQRTLQIQGKEEQLKSVEAGIVQKENQIKQLMADIETQKEQLDKIKNELQEAVVRIDLTNAQFMTAHKSISQQMMDDIQNIKNYIE
jgi:hypothetical protein